MPVGLLRDLYSEYKIYIYILLCFTIKLGSFFFWGGIVKLFIYPVQFPLHEPYFDLTPIRVTHTKIVYLNIITDYNRNK